MIIYFKKVSDLTENFFRIVLIGIACIQILFKYLKRQFLVPI